MKCRCWLVIFIGATFSHACGADIYSFTDAAGTVHFSNVPNDERYAILLAAATEETMAGEKRSADSYIAAARQYEGLIEAAAEQNSLEPELIHAVIAVESGYNARAVSSAGAQGLMQLMPATARRYGVRNILDPAQNIGGGAHYLADLRKRYQNDMQLVLAAYNAGEQAVDRHNAIPPYGETRRYVPRVLDIYRRLIAAASGPN